MKSFVFAVMATAGMGLLGGAALAQGKDDSPNMTPAPTMVECQHLHDRVLGGLAPNDVTGRQAALEALDDATGVEMKVCLAMMETPSEPVSTSGKSGDASATNSVHH